MLIFNFEEIGNRLLVIRKKSGMTQSEVAEVAGLSDRTYADIERGTVNMRIETILRICKALQITPDDILTEEVITTSNQEENIMELLNTCSPKEKETALQLLLVYLQSLK